MSHIERLAKLSKRLNPDQFISVDVASLVHLFAAREILKKHPELMHEYSIASELDADEWDAEFRDKFNGDIGNRTKGARG